MTSKQLKSIINFILLHEPNQTNTAVRALLKSHPEQFIDLLNVSIDKAEKIPHSVANFINEMNKQMQNDPVNQTPPTKENITMENSKKTTIIMRLVSIVKGMWTKTIHFVKANANKIKLIVSAVTVASLAVITSKGTALLTLFAALKSRSFIKTILAMYTPGINWFRKAKLNLNSKLAIVLDMIKTSGLVVFDRILAAKDFVISKVKQAWNWTVELFSTESTNEHYEQAA